MKQKKATNNNPPTKAGEAERTPNTPMAIDLPMELRELRQTLEVSIRDLKAALGTAVSEGVRGQLEHDLLARIEQAVQQRFDRTNAELEARDKRVTVALAQAQESVGAATTRLSVVSEDVLAERIHGAVLAATRTAADEVFQREFQRRLTELEGLFEDVDDQFAKVRAYVEQFGPGGLPVLAQRVEAEVASRAQLARELELAREDQKRLQAAIDDLESARRRSKASEGIDPEVIDRKLAELDTRDRDLADRESLSAANQRLARDLERMRQELREWRDRDLADQRAEADQKALQHALDERRDADEARARADHALAAARGRINRLEGEVERLQQSLQDLAVQMAAAENRDRRLEELSRQVDEITGLHEDARTTLAEHETLVVQLRAERQGLRIELGQARDDLARTREDARHALVAEQTEQRAQERARLDTWAEGEAALRAAEHVARVERLNAERQRLETLVIQLREDLWKARVDAETERSNRTGLEAQLHALEATVAERKRMQDAEDTDRRRRFVTELAEERARVQAEARAVGEREAEAARQDADELTRRADAVEVRIVEREALLVEVSGAITNLEGQRGQLDQIVADLERRVDELRLKEVPEEERLAELRRPVFAAADLLPIADAPPSEEQWLDQLQRRIREAGFAFHPRLVRAFHTSLKIADQAPLTVLAGISGTGKSELPRLYSDLGGLPFLELAVQPRWDSPDDLFGFFNYTDGRLKAEPLARLLHQVGNPDDALGQGPTVVLLDEMNIARVEYYFSDLLSKLEARRTVARNGTDNARHRASIRLSAGSSGGEIPLYPDERILFVGTMNEDESTMTLSDKVLDRACLLTFPAPRQMALREQGSVQRPPNRLSWQTWSGWRNRKDLAATAGVANRLNRINDLMEQVHRPFGHRLFRAIHAYIASYPAGDNASPKDAWSDQFAMKILPRLRGLECGDRVVASTLDALREHVPDDLSSSFADARNREFFAWAGAADLYRVGD